MRVLKIGTEKYTRVVAGDEKEFNANHFYSVETVAEPNFIVGQVQFQKGPIKECQVNGVMNEDLIAMVIDRLQSFQDSKFSCRENALALTKLEEALMWLRHRTELREKRNVEGTSAV